VHRRNVVNQPAFLTMDRLLILGMTILVEAITNLGTSYPKVDHLRSLCHMGGFRMLIFTQDASLSWVDMKSCNNPLYAPIPNTPGPVSWHIACAHQSQLLSDIMGVHLRKFSHGELWLLPPLWSLRRCERCERSERDMTLERC
jgi:hypothetical protein